MAEIVIMDTTTVYGIVPIAFGGCSASGPATLNTPPLKNGKFQCGNDANTIDCITEEEIKRLEMWNRIEIQRPLS